MELLSRQTRRFPLASALPVPVSSGKKTIFLVHSSIQYSSPIKAALQDRGYAVVHADTAEAALQTWAKLSCRVDLFLADISLGKDQEVERLVKLLQAENPRMRVLYANDLEVTCPSMAQTYFTQLAGVVENCLA